MELLNWFILDNMSCFV